MSVPRILKFSFLLIIYFSLVFLILLGINKVTPSMLPFASAFAVIPLVNLLINRIIRRKSRRQIIPFSANSMIRNIDYLIIGDMCNPSGFLPEGSNYIQLCRPNRGLVASYQILRHTHSILKEEGGVVVFVIKPNQLTGETYSIFDLPFFHKTTIRELNLENKVHATRWPLAFEPINSIKFLMNRMNDVKKDVSCTNEEIIAFCRDRGIELRLKVVD